MQQTKVLTAGEGGAVVTRDETVYELLQQLRADGRVLVDKPCIGSLELDEVGSLQGNNSCLSELACAVLEERLEHLPLENELRERNAVVLESLLLEEGLADPQARGRGTDHRAYQAFCFRVRSEAFPGLDVHAIGGALSAELGLAVGPIYRPIAQSRLYNPLSSSNFPSTPEYRRRLDPNRRPLPNAETAAEQYLSIPHPALLGDRDDMHDVVEALRKVSAGARSLSHSALQAVGASR